MRYILFSTFVCVLSIENTEIGNQNSEITYDLRGRRVDNPVKGGIYIRR